MTALSMHSERQRHADTYEYRLWCVARDAFERWQTAGEIYSETLCALAVDAEAERLAKRRYLHCARRYNQLESALADYTNLAKFSVFNQIAAFWPRVLAYILERNYTEVGA